MRIFFASYGGAHVAAIIPVYREMVRRGHTCQFLALTTAGEVARRAGIPHCRPIDYISTQSTNISEWGARLAERHHTEGKGLLLEESIAYLGVSFRDLAMDLGMEGAWARYAAQGLNAFCPVYFMREVLNKERPCVVVATTSPRMEKATLRAAYQLGIPSLCMVELFGLMEELWLSRPDNGHVLAVSRPEVIDRLAAAGRERSDIFLTGSPMFDQLADPTLPGAGREWRRAHGVADHERLVFWAEQPEPLDPDLPRRVRCHLAGVCLANGWRMVVRLHPSSTDGSREQIPEGCLQSHAHEPLPHVIHACDAGVTLTSTVGWEVLLSQKPLLVITMSPYSHTVTYGNGDGALAVHALEGVEQGLCDLLEGGGEAERLSALRRALPTPGEATRHICDLIESEVMTRHGHGAVLPNPTDSTMKFKRKDCK